MREGGVGAPSAVGNAGKRVFGRIWTVGHAGVRCAYVGNHEPIATFAKGELMVPHPHFTQPVFFRFPRPPVLTGPEKLKCYPPATPPVLATEDAYA